jgi:hypothetical protein
MIRRSISARLGRLEQHAGGSVDLAAEAAQYGEPVWASVPRWRCYARTDPDAARITVAGPAGVTRYEVAGVDVRDLA